MALRGEIILCVLPSTGTFTFNHAVHTTDRAKGFVFLEAASIDGNQREIYSLGYADANGNNIGNAAGQGSEFGVCLACRAYQSSYSIVSESTSAFFGGAVARMRAYVSAVNIGSFDITVDLNLVPGAGYYAVMLTGDSDVSISVGIASTANPQPRTVTLGFRPVALLTLGVTEGVNDHVAGLFHNNGFAVACGEEQVGLSSSSGSILNTAGGFASDSFIERDYNIVTHTFGTNGTYKITSWNADGFTIDRTAGTTNFGMWSIGYMAIGGNGVSANLVQIAQPAAVGGQTVSLQVDAPVVAFFSSRCKPSSAAVLFDANMMFGVCLGAQQRVQTFAFPDLTPFPYSRDAYLLDTRCISMATATGVSTSTVNADASGTLSANTLSLDWSIVDGTAREVWALVLATNTSGVFNACGSVPQPVCVPSPPSIPSTSVSPTEFSSGAVTGGGGVIV